MSKLRPREFVMKKGPNGYGFHLHGERGKSGQFVRLVEDDTPASEAGLVVGDQLVFVNGDSVVGESHQQVVDRIRATTGALELIVVDVKTAKLLQKHNLECRREFVTEGIPLPGGDSDSDAQSSGTPRGSSPFRWENGDAAAEKSERLSVSSITKDDPDELRPRLCYLKKDASGYGFHLHSDKSKPGQYIRAVDEDSPAQKAGLRPKDRIIQVNGVSVIGMQHSEVVAAIRAEGDETTLLVASPQTNEFFRRCKVIPSEEHVTGPLPEPASEDEEEVAAKPRASVSSSVSSAESNKSLPKEAERSPDTEPDPADSLDLGLSLAQARERAHQKRAAKKAPAMDWSKRNELFSNL